MTKKEFHLKALLNLACNCRALVFVNLHDNECLTQQSKLWAKCINVCAEELTAMAEKEIGFDDPEQPP